MRGRHRWRPGRRGGYRSEGQTRVAPVSRVDDWWTEQNALRVEYHAGGALRKRSNTRKTGAEGRCRQRRRSPHAVPIGGSPHWRRGTRRGTQSLNHCGKAEKSCREVARSCSQRPAEGPLRPPATSRPSGELSAPIEKLRNVMCRYTHTSTAICSVPGRRPPAFPLKQLRPC